MKKDTVITFLNKLEREAKLVKDESRRLAKLTAIQQCRGWLDLTWADMLSPVNTKLDALTTEAKPLLQKEEEQTLTPEDTTHLQGVRAIYTIVYQFRQKIYPTAHHASVERGIRKSEKTSHKA